MTAVFVSHARTPEQLQAEVISDIRRRIDNVGSYSEHVAKSATEKARYASVIRELESMLDFWTKLKIERPRRMKGDHNG